VAQLILDVVVRLHGIPISIVFDRDKILTSNFWRELFRLTDTKLITSTAYHPQIDGQFERVNQCLEMFLKCCVHDNPKKWKAVLPLAEYWYNTSFHTSLGCTPFKILYGYDPVVSAAPMLPVTENHSVQELLYERKLHTKLIKQHLLKVQNRIKMQADKNMTDREFLLKL
jgi:hypothetical protein